MKSDFEKREHPTVNKYFTILFVSIIRAAKTNFKAEQSKRSATGFHVKHRINIVIVALKQFLEQLVKNLCVFFIAKKHFY